MSMMMFMRGSGFAALGAVVMVVALAAAGAMYLTQLGKAGRQRRVQRERYQDYLEELREQLREDEQRLQEQATVLDPFRSVDCSTSCAARRGCGSAAAPTSTSYGYGSAWARCPSGRSNCASRAHRPTP